MRKPVVIYGNGTVAETVHFYFRHDAAVEVAAFTVDPEFIKEETLLGLPLVPFDQVVSLYPPEAYDMFIGVGHVRVNRVRAAKYAAAKQLGYQLINYISSKAITWPGLKMGDNCKIGTAAQISPFAQLGNNVTIGGGCHVGHHTIIGDHVSLAPRATIVGTVVVEPYCLIGANATIRDRVTIARECVIGAGAVILEDTQEKGVYLGSPAEKLPISSDRLPVG
jgi:sugar O-acyltransferase (sialic acid O-acetyltransferase NeuD family)